MSWAIKRKSKTPRTKNVMKASDEARLSLPIILKVLNKSKLVEFQPSQFDDLNLDWYQRSEIRDITSDISYAIRHGGIVPDPITVSRRPSGKLFIVDGQQRFWAHVDAQKPIRAWVYDVPRVETEVKMFNVLNRRVQVGGQFRVNAWPGPVAELIRSYNANTESFLYQRINLGNNSGRPYDSTVVVRGLVAVISRSARMHFSGSIQKVLEKSDVLWERNAGSLRIAEAYLSLMHNVFPGPGRMKYLAAIALGRVAARRLKEKMSMPNGSVTRRLRNLNWGKFAQVPSTQFLPSIEAAIEKIWPA